MHVTCGEPSESNVTSPVGPGSELVVSGSVWRLVLPVAPLDAGGGQVCADGGAEVDRGRTQRPHLGRVVERQQLVDGSYIAAGMAGNCLADALPDQALDEPGFARAYNNHVGVVIVRDLDVVYKLLGHSSTMVTEKGIHTTSEATIRRVVHALVR